MRAFTLVCFALIFSGRVCASGFISGNTLAEWLNEKDKPTGSPFKSGLFSGYVSGVVDAENDVAFCTGPGVTAGQYNAVVAKYVKAHPEQWDKGALHLVVAALKEAFPCAKK